MKNPPSGKRASAVDIEALAQAQADEMGFELVEASLVKESRGKCLLIFIDKEGGISLDDCEKYHKLLQPKYEAVDYDIMEVSSPGVDRPIKNLRDFEKNRGKVVEVHLFAPIEGSKLHRGTLEAMDEANVTIRIADESEISFPRKAISLIKPVIELAEEDFADVEFDSSGEMDAMDPDEPAVESKE